MALGQREALGTRWPRPRGKPVLLQGPASPPATPGYSLFPAEESNFPTARKAPPWNVPPILEAQLTHLPATACLRDTPIIRWDRPRVLGLRVGLPESPRYAFRLHRLSSPTARRRRLLPSHAGGTTCLNPSGFTCGSECDDVWTAPWLERAHQKHLSPLHAPHHALQPPPAASWAPPPPAQAGSRVAALQSP